MPRTRLVSFASLLAAMTVVGAPASAHPRPQPPAAPPVPTEVVYATNHETAIVRVDFDNGRAEAINRDGDKLEELAGLLVRNDGAGRINLVACDKEAGKVLFYEDVQGSGFDGKGKLITDRIPAPDGISADASGNLYLVSSGSDDDRSQLWTIPRGGSHPGGYGGAVLIDGNVRSEELEDTKVVRSGGGKLAAGDLLVLSREPARVLRYRKVAGKFAFLDDFIGHFSDDAEPTGFAFAPNGNLLVVNEEGDILRYNGNGVKLSNFFSHVGDGVFRIAVGFQTDDGQSRNRAFVTQAEDDSVIAFDIQADGTGSRGPSVSRGVRSPKGIGIGNGNAAAIPVTDTRVTADFDTHTSTFEKVRQAGFTDVTCRLLRADPREGVCGPSACEAKGGTCILDNTFCNRPLFLDELDPKLKHAEIPSHVRALRIGHPVEGSPQFFFCEGKTTAKFKFAAVTEEEHEFLKWPGDAEPACNEQPTSKRSMFFWTPIPGAEPAINEGARFIDLSTGCGNSNRGDVDDYSYFLPAAREMRPFKQVVDDGLDGLEGAIEQLQGSILNGDVRGQLRAKRTEAKTAFNRFKDFGCASFRQQAITALGDFIGTIEGHTEAFDNSARNVSGELLVRARSAIWIISNVPVPATPNTCCQNPSTCN